MTAGICTVLRRTTMLAAVASSAVGLAALQADPVRPTEDRGANLAQAQVVPPKKKSTEDVDQTAMARCLETWDRATQMTKEEWRESCRRSIQQNPGLYTKPF
ncbi:MAG TPA: hypothetical protein VFR73_10225 [Hyphomicrobiaceae bacterium]|nr:hypothetical protein [Hyphomicrobiaceae bacterium]